MVHGTVNTAERERNEQLQQELSTDDPLRKYKVMKKIGSGSTSEVYKGESYLGEEVAIKMMPKRIDPSDGLIFPRFINEIVIQRDHPHPNMAKYLDSYMMGKYIWIVMEHVDGVSLADVAQRMKLTPSQIAAIARQMLQILKHLHSEKIIHGDIKSENLLLGTDGVVKLIDFGFAQRENGDVASRQGTPCFMAPEVIRSTQPHSVSADIWAFGITLFEMCVGYVPYQEEDADRAYELILQHGKPTLPENELVDERMKNVLDQCLQVDPSTRISAANLLLHPFLQHAENVGAVKELVKTFQCSV